MMSMIVVALRRADTKRAWPARHSSSRSLAAPRRSRHQALVRSTSDTVNTTWSIPMARMGRPYRDEVARRRPLVALRRRDAVEQRIVEQPTALGATRAGGHLVD